MTPYHGILRGILFFTGVLITFYIGLALWGSWYDEWSGYNASVSVSDGYCTIAVLSITGDVYGSGVSYDESGNELLSMDPDTFGSELRRAEADPNILGVLVQVDSGGGSPVGGEMLAELLKTSPLPSAAVIRDMGASAAYLAATGADTIIASPFSNVGSIGITMSYLNYAEQNELSGISYEALSSVPFKDAGSQDKELTAEERARFEEDLAFFHDEFVRMVAANRNIPVEEVAAIADGATLPAALALKAKLIDAIGNEETARLWFAEQLGLDATDVAICYPW